MAAATTHTPGEPRFLRRGHAPQAWSRRLVMALLAFMVASDASLLMIGFVRSPHVLRDIGMELLVWSALSFLVGLAPVASGSAPQLGMELPLLLAAGFTYGPFVAGLVALLGYSDLREFRGRIGVVRALYNRSQTSLSTMAAAAAFGALGGHVGDWPAVAGAAFVALAADCLVNYSSVLAVRVLHDGLPLGPAVRSMKFGSPGGFAITYACFGFLGLLLAEIHAYLGLWGLGAFAIPVLLAWQAFSHTRRLDDATTVIKAKDRALEAMSTQIADERREERLVVAAGLHDEVLPPLYQVHLMGQVLRQDLAAGRLLALEEDLPALLEATHVANEAARSLIHTLRDSKLGANGLTNTLRLLVRDLEVTCESRFHMELEEVGGSPLVQLLAYQVAREALRNAARHAHASDIRLSVTRDGSDMWILISDNGVGFTPGSVDEDQHFGLQLMRERVELAGGVLDVETSEGTGTQVSIRLPAETVGGVSRHESDRGRA